MTTTIYRHPECAAHDMGVGHPESPARLCSVEAALTGLADNPKVVDASAPLADVDALKRVHEPATVDYFFDIEPTTGCVPLDADTILMPQSLAAARRAAGAAIAAVDAVMCNETDNAFCAVRPPGHHAERNRAMGFCFFNTIAVAAAHALDEYNLERVAILDFDVHHGNGTEDIFREEPRVLFCSTYQNPLFPYTTDQSLPGRLIKSPLLAGHGRDAFRGAIEQDWLPALAEYRPQLVLVSAGFDAHRDDPLAQLELEADDFAWVGEQITAVADRHASGRMLATLEGGYNLAALTDSTTAYLRTLIGAG